jgi:hypothetical protein
MQKQSLYKVPKVEMNLVCATGMGVDSPRGRYDMRLENRWCQFLQGPENQGKGIRFTFLWRRETLKRLPSGNNPIRIFKQPSRLLCALQSAEGR